MKLFLGILFAVTQSLKKGEIKRSFDVCSDGLFPDPDLGNFDLNTGALKSFFLIVHILPYTTVIIKIIQTPIGK